MSPAIGSSPSSGYSQARSIRSGPSRVRPRPKPGLAGRTVRRGPIASGNPGPTTRSRRTRDAPAVDQGEAARRDLQVEPPGSQDRRIAIANSQTRQAARAGRPGRCSAGARRSPGAGPTPASGAPEGHGSARARSRRSPPGAATDRPACSGSRRPGPSIPSPPRRHRIRTSPTSIGRSGEIRNPRSAGHPVAPAPGPVTIPGRSAIAPGTSRCSSRPNPLTSRSMARRCGCSSPPQGRGPVSGRSPLLRHLPADRPDAPDHPAAGGLRLRGRRARDLPPDRAPGSSSPSKPTAPGPWKTPPGSRRPLRRRYPGRARFPGRPPQGRPGPARRRRFCFGGHLAFRAALQPDVKATTCFYGTGIHNGKLGSTPTPALWPVRARSTASS